MTPTPPAPARPAGEEDAAPRVNLRPVARAMNAHRSIYVESGYSMVRCFLDRRRLKVCGDGSVQIGRERIAPEHVALVAETLAALVAAATPPAGDGGGEE